MTVCDKLTLVYRLIFQILIGLACILEIAAALSADARLSETKRSCNFTWFFYKNKADK